MRADQVLFTYLHLAARQRVHRGADRVRHHRDRLRDRAAGRRLAAAARADERGRRPDGAAGRRAHLQRDEGGRGVLMGGVSGVYAAKVVVLGAGVSGMNAAAIALGMQAEVLLLDKNIDKLRAGRPDLPGPPADRRLERLRGRAGLPRRRPGHRRGAGAGAKAPMLVSDDLVSRMKPGSVLVDIAVDQGGCFESTRPTTHSDPTFGCTTRSFYCVANMPGAVPHTSTYALTNVTLPYVERIADLGWQDAARGDPALALRA